MNDHKQCIESCPLGTLEATLRPPSRRSTSGGGDLPAENRRSAASHDHGCLFRHEKDDRVTLKLSYPSRKLAHARRVATMASTNSARVAGGFRQRISPTLRMSSSGIPDTCATTRNAAGKFRRPFCQACARVRARLAECGVSGRQCALRLSQEQHVEGRRVSLRDARETSSEASRRSRPRSVLRNTSRSPSFERLTPSRTPPRTMLSIKQERVSASQFSASADSTRGPSLAQRACIGARRS